ncbi:MAG: hypothetical protein OEV78_13000 [Spirochaetia bacterium]|nr:hypothetical protein [Spirochaetia bacterium]
MTTTIHLRVSEKTKEKYYQKYYEWKSKNMRKDFDHDDFLNEILQRYSDGTDAVKER